MNANPVFFLLYRTLLRTNDESHATPRRGRSGVFLPSGTLLQLTHHPSCLGPLWGLHDHTAAVLLLRLRIEHLTLRT